MNPALLMSLVLATQNPVQLQLSSMSTANVQVAQDGYLLVLGRAARGQPLVIYPNRPGRSGHLAAGATVKLRSLRAASWVAVWSAQPFDGEPFTANTYWSSDSLRRQSDLVAIARRMAGDAPIEYAVASAPPVSFALSQPDARARRVTFSSPQYPWLRQAKFAGGPPDICNATMCMYSVWRQLGDMRFGNAP